MDLDEYNLILDELTAALHLPGESYESGIIAAMAVVQTFADANLPIDDIDRAGCTPAFEEQPGRLDPTILPSYPNDTLCHPTETIVPLGVDCGRDDCLVCRAEFNRSNFPQTNGFTHIAEDYPLSDTVRLYTSDFFIDGNGTTCCYAHMSNCCEICG